MRDESGSWRDVIEEVSVQRGFKSKISFLTLEKVDQLALFWSFCSLAGNCAWKL